MLTSKKVIAGIGSAVVLIVAISQGREALTSLTRISGASIVSWARLIHQRAIAGCRVADGILAIVCGNALLFSRANTIVASINSTWVTIVADGDLRATSCKRASSIQSEALVGSHAGALIRYYASTLDTVTLLANRRGVGASTSAILRSMSAAATIKIAYVSSTAISVIAVDSSADAITVDTGIGRAAITRRTSLRNRGTRSISSTYWEHARVGRGTLRSPSALTATACIDSTRVVIIAHLYTLATIGQIAGASVTDARVRGL